MSGSTQGCWLDFADDRFVCTVVRVTPDEATTHDPVTDPHGRAALLAASGRTGAQIVERLYYSALSRPPRSTERQVAERALATAPSLRQGAEDLLWALINTREFGGIR